MRGKDNQCYLDAYLWKDEATDVDLLSQQGSQMNHVMIYIGGK